MAWTKGKNFITVGRDGFDLRAFTVGDGFIRLDDFFPPALLSPRVSQTVRLSGSLGRAERSQSFDMMSGDCVRIVAEVDDGCGGKADLLGVNLVWKFMEKRQGMEFFRRDNYDKDGIQVVHDNEHTAIIEIRTDDTIDADGLYYHKLTQIHDDCRNTLFTGKIRVLGSSEC